MCDFERSMASGKPWGATAIGGEAVGAIGFAGQDRDIVVADWVLWPAPDAIFSWDQQVVEFLFCLAVHLVK